MADRNPLYSTDDAIPHKSGKAEYSPRLRFVNVDGTVWFARWGEIRIQIANFSAKRKKLFWPIAFRQPGGVTSKSILSKFFPAGAGKKRRHIPGWYFDTARREFLKIVLNLWAKKTNSPGLRNDAEKRGVIHSERHLGPLHEWLDSM